MKKGIETKACRCAGQPDIRPYEEAHRIVTGHHYRCPDRPTRNGLTLNSTELMEEMVKIVRELKAKG